MATTAKSMPGEIYMDDFLHNLRNPNKKRFDRNKPYDSQYRSNDRFSGNRKTPPQQRKPSDSDQMPAIKRLMENILDQQKRLAEFNERMARATERQADALESIAGRFKPQPAEADLPVALATSVESPSEPTPDVLPDGHMEMDTASAESPAETTTPALAADEADGRETAETIIRQQRAMGNGFEQIAQTLNAQGVPTVSGKGQWRAQSVSRLYNTLTPAAADTAAPPA